MVYTYFYVSLISDKPACQDKEKKLTQMILELGVIRQQLMDTKVDVKYWSSAVKIRELNTL